LRCARKIGQEGARFVSATRRRFAMRKTADAAMHFEDSVWDRSIDRC
jgi:hypothetical protein